MCSSPFCNLSRRRWMGGGVRVGCGAGGTPTGRLMAPTEPPPDTETPRQPPGHFGRRPNWANAAGEPPARFRGTLRPPPALGPASGGDTTQRVRVVCRFEKVTHRCSPRTESFSARRLSATRSCTCWQISAVDPTRPVHHAAEVDPVLLRGPGPFPRRPDDRRAPASARDVVADVHARLLWNEP